MMMMISSEMRDGGLPRAQKLAFHLLESRGPLELWTGERKKLLPEIDGYVAHTCMHSCGTCKDGCTHGQSRSARPIVMDQPLDRCPYPSSP